MAVSDRNTDQSPGKFSWKRTIQGLPFGSNIRETIEDIRVIRGVSKKDSGEGTSPLKEGKPGDSREV